MQRLYKKIAWYLEYPRLRQPESSQRQNKLSPRITCAFSVFSAVLKFLRFFSRRILLTQIFLKVFFYLINCYLYTNIIRKYLIIIFKQIHLIRLPQHKEINAVLKGLCQGELLYIVVYILAANQ